MIDTGQVNEFIGKKQATDCPDVKMSKNYFCLIYGWAFSQVVGVGPQKFTHRRDNPMEVILKKMVWELFMGVPNVFFCT